MNLDRGMFEGRVIAHRAWTRVADMLADDYGKSRKSLPWTLEELVPDQVLVGLMLHGLSDEDLFGVCKFTRLPDLDNSPELTEALELTIQEVAERQFMGD